MGGGNPFPFPVSVVLNIFITLWKAELDSIKKLRPARNKLRKFNYPADKMKKSNFYL